MQQQINVLGQEIRRLRQEANESLATAAAGIGIDRSHLNKVELGTYKPSLELLNRIIAHFSIEGKKARQLRDYIERGLVEHVVVDGEKRKEKPMNQDIQAPELALQVNVDPAKIQVLYSDSIFVDSSDYGLVLNIAQNAPGTPQQQFIVSRIGMSFDHAKKLLEVMNDNLQKHER